MQQKRHIVDIVFVLGLFCVYTAGALFLAVIGADIYRQGVQSAKSNYNIRTSILYLTEKVRANDTAGGVAVRHIGGQSALVLNTQMDGEDYETWIYMEDGYLCEVLLEKGGQVTNGIGQEIMQISDIVFELEEDRLLLIDVTDIDGQTADARVWLECGGRGRLT